jgi:hypothetical protein
LAWGKAQAERHLLASALAKMLWRGVGVIGRIEQLDYWDGEELKWLFCKGRRQLRHNGGYEPGAGSAYFKT